MARIGLIGAGNIGSTIARLASGTSHEVILSNSRGPGTLTTAAAELGPHVTPGTIQDAAAADIVVVTIPLNRLSELQQALDDHLACVVIDTMNYYPQRDGQIPALDQHHTTTSELTAQAFPQAQVVKGFNNIVHSHLLNLARPHGAADRSTLPIASDHDDAKQTVAALFDDLGYDTLDVGALSEGWRFENGQPAYCLPYAADPDAMRASTPGNRPAGSRAVDAETLRAELNAASRR